LPIVIAEVTGLLFSCGDANDLAIKVLTRGWTR
jgi:hypothetical protein